MFLWLFAWVHISSFISIEIEWVLLGNTFFKFSRLQITLPKSFYEFCSYQLCMIVYNSFKFFNWRKIALQCLQCCVGFCCITMKISHNCTHTHTYTHTHTPSLLSLLPYSHILHSRSPDCQAGLSVLYSSFPQAICFIHDNVYMSMLLSQFVPSSPSPTGMFLCIWCFQILRHFSMTISEMVFSVRLICQFLDH